MKHGLTGDGTCLLDIAKGEVEAELAAFTAAYEPRDAVERRLVEQAALASVRHNRAQTQSEAMTLRRCTDAVRRHDEARDVEVAGAMARLHDDPIGSLAVLRATAEGCDAMEDAWDALRESLESRGGWTVSQGERALRLLGRATRPTLDDEPFFAELWRNVLATSGELDSLPYVWFFGALPRDLPDRDEAAAALLALAESEIERWKARGAENWETTDSRARAGAVSSALVDLADEAQKLHRYQVQSSREMRQSLRGVESHRREKRRSEQDEHRRARDAGPRRNEPISPVARSSQPMNSQGFTPNKPAPSPAPAAADPDPRSPATAAPDAPAGPPEAPLGPEIDPRSSII